MTSASPMPDWIKEARHRLIRLFAHDCAWGYSRDGMIYTEPTALACLALRATQNAGEIDLPEVEKAARWLASIQTPNGAIGISPTLPSPEWPTPYAILVWSEMEEYTEQTAKAIKWLLECKGSSIRRQPNISPEDTTIVGWPWVTQTHSWIMPTAMAVLALRKQGLQHHERVHEGLRLIMDRSIPTGGWNYGNNIVYGSMLRPQPADTGMALLALSGLDGAETMAALACAYLESIIPKLRAPQSLSWALLGLTAWGRRPSATEQWLELSYEYAINRSEKAPQLSYLLLAASDRSVQLLSSRTDTTEANL